MYGPPVSICTLKGTNYSVEDNYLGGRLTHLLFSFGEKSRTGFVEPVGNVNVNVSQELEQRQAFRTNLHFKKLFCWTRNLLRLFLGANNDPGLPKTVSEAKLGFDLNYYESYTLC